MSLSIQGHIFDLQINSILFFTIPVGIVTIPLKSSKKLLRLSCWLPLTSSLGKYLFGIKNEKII